MGIPKTDLKRHGLKHEVHLNKMLLSIIGFIFGTLISLLIGAIVLVLHPKWKITFLNMILFVVGSFFWVIMLSLIYSKLFADGNGTFHSTAAVLGYFALLIIAVIGGGIVTTHIGRKLFKLEKRE